MKSVARWFLMGPGGATLFFATLIGGCAWIYFHQPADNASRLTSDHLRIYETCQRLQIGDGFRRQPRADLSPRERKIYQDFCADGMAGDVAGDLVN